MTSQKITRARYLAAATLLLATACGGDNSSDGAETTQAMAGLQTSCGGQRSTCPANQGLGLYVTSSATLDARERFIGSPAKYAVLFPARKTATQLVASIEGSMRSEERNLEQHANRMTYSWSFAPIFYGNERFNAKSAEGRTRIREHLQKTIDGENDDGFRRVAEKLVEVGQGDSIIRLGHEMTGTWFQWSAVGNCDAFSGAWRRVHRVMKQVAPHLKFDFTAAGSQNNAVLVPCAWPGDAYVDIVGVDFYDRGAGRAYFDASKPGWTSPAEVWNRFQLRQLDAIRSFAILHGKPMSIPEWGLEGRQGTGGGIEGPANIGGDNPYFVQSLYAWINLVPRDRPGGVLYHSYFWAQPSGEGPHNLDDESLRLSARSFKELYGAVR